MTKIKTPSDYKSYRALLYATLGRLGPRLYETGNENAVLRASVVEKAEALSSPSAPS